MEGYRIYSKLTGWVNLLIRDVTIFLKSPKAYLFSFSFSTSKKVRIRPYDPKATQIGNELSGKLQNLFPDLKVYFVGAANLGIAQGDGDIDLLIVSSDTNFDMYLPKLTSVLGKPDKRREGFMEWHTYWKKYPVEVTLSDSENPIIQEPLRGYLILKKNPDYLKEYEQIKLKSHGISQREYKKRKLEFFNRISR